MQFRGVQRRDFDKTLIVAIRRITGSTVIITMLCVVITYHWSHSQSNDQWLYEACLHICFDLDYVPSSDNLTDICTKSLPRPHFENLRQLRREFFVIRDRWHWFIVLHVYRCWMRMGVEVYASNLANLHMFGSGSVIGTAAKASMKWRESVWESVRVSIVV